MCVHLSVGACVPGTEGVLRIAPDHLLLGYALLLAGPGPCHAVSGDQHPAIRQGVVTLVLVLWEGDGARLKSV